MSSIASLTKNNAMNVEKVRTLPPSSIEVADAFATIRAWEGYQPTVIVDRPGLAADCGVAAVQLKLEADRFDIASFKALGPPYALQRAVERARRTNPGVSLTAVTATSGNHGLALAWGARRLGLPCIAVMPSHTSLGRERAIRALGAEVVRAPGGFEEAITLAASLASKPGQLLIADHDGAVAERAACETIVGYSLMAREIVDGDPFNLPTHLFVAAGNGSLAAAVCHRLIGDLPDPPKIITAEPFASDAVRRSLAVGSRVFVPGGASIMDGLVTALPSRVAWQILQHGITAGLAISDRWAITVLRDMAKGTYGDGPLEMGETGVAAVAGLIAAAHDPKCRTELGICRRSNLMAIVCEGVTDRDVFNSLVGLTVGLGVSGGTTNIGVT